jgi:hypothetical protein
VRVLAPAALPLEKSVEVASRCEPEGDVRKALHVEVYVLLLRLSGMLASTMTNYAKINHAQNAKYLLTIGFFSSTLNYISN